MQNSRSEYEFSIQRFASQNEVGLVYPDAFNASVSSEAPLPGSHFTTTSVDSSDKFTEGCTCCVALVCAGKKIDGEAVSFMMHIASPILREPEPAGYFRQTLDERLSELKEGTHPESRLAFLAGGLYIQGDTLCGLPISKSYKEDYKEKVRLLSKKVSEGIGADLLIAQGPKKIRWDRTDVAYLTAKRKLLIIEGPQPRPDFVFTFPSKDIDRVLPYNWSDMLSNKIAKAAEGFLSRF